MIEETKVNKVSTEGVLRQVRYHINPDNIVHITQILRDQYSNPVKAIVREYTANALDAHVQAGIAQRPIEISVPTLEDPTFRVRDYGPGLSEADTEELLMGYGSSGEHKRTSNTQIGGFGIGCKCAFAGRVTDQFQYVVHHGGLKRVWSSFLDETDMSQAALLSKEPSNETGIEVIVPVRSDVLDSFKREIATLFMYWDVQPKLVGPGKSLVCLQTKPKSVMEDRLIVEIKGAPSEVKWRILESRNSEPAVVMGGLVYPVDLDQVPEVRGFSYASKQFANRVHVVCPIGMLQLAPNREALQYSQRTQHVLQKLYTVLLTGDFLTDRLDVILKGAGTCSQKRSSAQVLWERTGLSSGDRLGSALMKRLMKSGITPSGYFSEVPSGTQVGAQVWTAREQRYWNHSVPGGKYDTYIHLDSRSPDSMLNPNVRAVTLPIAEACIPYVVMVTDDKVQPGYDSGYVKRVIHTMRNLPAVKSNPEFDFGTGTTRDTRASLRFVSLHSSEDMLKKLADNIPWLKDGSVGILWDKDLVAAADVPAGEYSRNQGAPPRASRGPVQRTRYAAHGKRLVSFLPDKAENHIDAHSEAWAPCKAKEVTDGLYVVIQKFLPKGPQGYTIRLADLASVVKCLNEQKLISVPVYGIRSKDVESIKAVKGLVPLWDFIAKIIPEAVKRGVYTEDALEAAYRRYYLRGYHSELNAWYERVLGLLKVPALKDTKLAKVLREWVAKEKPDSPFSSLVRELVHTLGTSTCHLYPGEHNTGDKCLLWGNPITKGSVLEPLIRGIIDQDHYNTKKCDYYPAAWKHKENEKAQLTPWMKDMVDLATEFPALELLIDSGSVRNYVADNANPRYARGSGVGEKVQELFKDPHFLKYFVREIAGKDETKEGEV